MSADPVPAVVEAEATGETAALFADIRAVYAVPNVNLIWRHLATISGGLPAVWSVVRPLYVSGAVAEAAGRLKDQAVLPVLLPIPAAPAIRDVLETYDRTNSMALVALGAAGIALAGEGRGAASETIAPPLPPGPALPALCDPARLPAQTRDLIMALNRLGSVGPAPVLASMWRHLAHWPDYLASAHAALAPVEPALRDAIASYRMEAAALSRAIAPAAPLGAPEVRAAIARFAGEVIPRMAVICGMLRRAAGQADA